MIHAIINFTEAVMARECSRHNRWRIRHLDLHRLLCPKLFSKDIPRRETIGVREEMTISQGEAVLSSSSAPAH